MLDKTQVQHKPAVTLRKVIPAHSRDHKAKPVMPFEWNTAAAALEWDKMASHYMYLLNVMLPQIFENGSFQHCHKQPVHIFTFVFRMTTTVCLSLYIAIVDVLYTNK